MIVLAPLAGAVVTGLFGRDVGRSGAHWITIVGVGVSFVLSMLVFYRIVIAGEPSYNANVYTWLESGGIPFHVGFLVDESPFFGETGHKASRLLQGARAVLQKPATTHQGPRT